MLSGKQITAWHAENPGVFEEWVTTWQDMVYHTALGMLLHVQDAEDITQEVFIALYNNGSDFKQTDSVSAWLYRVTINRSIDILRKRKKKNSWWKHIQEETPDAELQQNIHPGVLAENKEHANALFDAMIKLPPDQHAVFVLQKMESKSVREIAGIMQKSEKAIESLLIRANRNLRKYLKNYYEQQLK